jgi:Protein of unknown function (DUF2971)
MQNNRCIQIYKYRSLSGQYGREAIERALLHNELYWQSPVSFNDPFDCAPVLYFGDNNAQREGFYKRAAKQVYNAEPRASRRRHCKEMASVPASKMEETLQMKWDEWLSDSAIACFSAVHDDPLMWGHYADSHKGVCLIFDEIANNETQWFAFPVSYQEARPRVNLTSFNDPNVMAQALLLKSNHWSYEHERRMIAWRKPPGYRGFPVQQIKGIILGAKIEDNDQTFVRALLENRPNLQVFRAEIDVAEFKLNIIPA